MSDQIILGRLYYYTQFKTIGLLFTYEFTTEIFLEC